MQRSGEKKFSQKTLAAISRIDANMSKVIVKTKKMSPDWIRTVHTLAAGTTQTTSTLFTCGVVPRTFSRLFFSGGIEPKVTGDFVMCVIILRDGLAQPGLSLTSGGTPYEPQEDVLWMDRWMINPTLNGNQVMKFNYDIKAQRKMKEGDRIRVVALGSSATVDMEFVSSLLAKT